MKRETSWERYLVDRLHGRGGAGAGVLRSRSSLLGSLQEILGGGRLPGAPIRPGPLQSPVELPGQSQAELRLFGLPPVARGPWVSAHRLTPSAHACVRGEILEDLGLGLRRGVRRSTGKGNQDI